MKHPHNRCNLIEVEDMYLDNSLIKWPSFRLLIYVCLLLVKFKITRSYSLFKSAFSLIVLASTFGLQQRLCLDSDFVQWPKKLWLDSLYYWNLVSLLI